MFSDEPVNGCLGFEIPLKPRSFQTNRLAKRALIKSIQDILAPLPYLFSGDVKITIAWSVDEQARYEGISSPDVDNIIKPMLDAFSGPRGLMIDDCQVQSIECYWADTWGIKSIAKCRLAHFLMIG
jgi:Holliday junction resolvase RusA-like endonuclease